MKIIVCVKVSKGEINHFDKSALECALQMSDDITVVSMGPSNCESVLKPLTRLGAKVVLISDSVYAGSDTLATSYVLSTAIKNMQYDLILCGRQSIDGDTAQVGPMLSYMLGCSLITNAMSVTLYGKCIKAVTRTGDESADFPAVVTLEKGYVLRFPSIFSKESDIKIIDNSTLCCDVSKCGINGSPTKVLTTYENQTGKRKCKYISFDDLDEVIKNALSKEQTEEIIPKSCNKLKNVWAVGDAVYKKALEISDDVTVISETDANEIIRMAKQQNPDVILFNADLWGRKIAPLVAAALDTGLCADCTGLETDGENLFMYRPAMGGNIIAKIKCETKPQMATVRTKSQSYDIVVSGGRGIGDIDKLNAFINKYNAQPGASRGLVDEGKAPYENQIGLTGKTVSPKVYIAIGISGAVHHTCAIEGAQTVIAINPDRDARIFEYADYGIVDNF